MLDPHDHSGLPEVLRHTPIPNRPSPLPGTRTLLCPKDPRLTGSFPGQGAIQLPRHPLAALVCGWVAMATTAGLIAHFWLAAGGRFSVYGADPRAWVVAMGLAVAHGCALFSQILSDSRNLPGGMAIPILYSGYIVSAVIDHIIVRGG